MQQYGDLYTGRLWVGCYMWYSAEGPGRSSPPINGQYTNFILFYVHYKGLREMALRCFARRVSFTNGSSEEWEFFNISFSRQTKQNWLIWTHGWLCQASKVMQKNGADVASDGYANDTRNSNRCQKTGTRKPVPVYDASDMQFGIEFFW